MHTRNLTVSLTAAAMLLATAPAIAGGVDAAMVSNTCAGCHGTNGVSEGEAPTIAGLPKEYLVSAMKTYRDDSRYSTIMGRIAKGYSDAEIDAMATFFAEQTWKPAAQETDPELVARGQTLHGEKFCGGCHGAGGEMSNDTTPQIAGQYAGYLYFQMLDIANPDTPISEGSKMMRTLFQALTEDDLKALAHFYASQQ
ncbi:MAG: c-type cytochrome [Gammaproteobacteria bacterium]|nr:c-type cytochrome [Gammaproteobacteria bacterium]